jgi:hypothetical protein
MFYLYCREVRDGETLYTQKLVKISLFGINSGWIPYLLRGPVCAGRFEHSLIPSEQGEPYPWYLDVRKRLCQIGHPGLGLDAGNQYSLVIDLKPNNMKRVLDFYELLHVWGYTNYGWTPAMVQLRQLRQILREEAPAGINPRDYEEFSIKEDEETFLTPIYSFWYFYDGRIEEGQLCGRWNPPPPAATNSALLWPQAIQYFLDKMYEAKSGVFPSLRPDK